MKLDRRSQNSYFGDDQHVGGWPRKNALAKRYTRGVLVPRNPLLGAPFTGLRRRSYGFLPQLFVCYFVVTAALPVRFCQNAFAPREAMAAMFGTCQLRPNSAADQLLNSWATSIGDGWDGGSFTDALSCRRSPFARSRTTKQPSSSLTDQGGGKRCRGDIGFAHCGHRRNVDAAHRPLERREAKAIAAGKSVRFT
jgi:hypothetical protein